jgi:hypothetical protein
LHDLQVCWLHRFHHAFLAEDEEIKVARVQNDRLQNTESDDVLQTEAVQIRSL